MAETTLLWHDYETWGTDPRRDRPVQFAALRTNSSLEEIEEPFVLWCRPGSDFLPNPEAVMLTGISPQEAAKNGLNEARFFGRISEAFARPGTCGVGYNSIRFDDEVTRFGFYRNFIDPYSRESQNGNSRWDIIDLLRMAYALRPEGISWPEQDNGTVSFRLELLAAANGIAHDAHDALSDVRATLALARLVRQLKPLLYEYYFKLRDRNEAALLLDLQKQDIVLHVSGMYPAAKGCIAPVVPLLAHPRNKQEIIVYDLRQNPHHLLTMSAEEMAENLYAQASDLSEGTERLALKGVHLNKIPALAPVSTLNAEQAEQWQIDWQQVRLHREELLRDATLTGRLTALYLKTPDRPAPDADAALYEGFISDADRRLCALVRQKSPEQLAAWRPGFADARLNALYFRYRARNWPESLNAREQEEWKHFCRERLLDSRGFTAVQYRQALEEMVRQGRADQQPELFRQLAEWQG